MSVMIYISSRMGFIERVAPLRPELARRAKEVRGERRCTRVTRSYAISDWNRGSVSSSTLAEICAGYTILSPVGRNEAPGLGNASASGTYRHDPFAVLRMLHPVLLNRR